MNPEYSKTIFLISKEPESWPDEFAIITAHNPMDLKLSDQENNFRNENLLKTLGQNAFLKLYGSSPDQSHQETSYAFISDLDQAIEIGREFQQRAIYYIRKGNLQLVDCNADTIIDLGNFKERVSLDQNKQGNNCRNI
jgi:hypothetical protein